MARNTNTITLVKASDKELGQSAKQVGSLLLNAVIGVASVLEVTVKGTAAAADNAKEGTYLHLLNTSTKEEMRAHGNDWGEEFASDYIKPTVDFFRFESQPKDDTVIVPPVKPDTESK